MFPSLRSASSTVALKIIAMAIAPLVFHFKRDPAVPGGTNYNVAVSLHGQWMVELYPRKERRVAVRDLRSGTRSEVYFDASDGAPVVGRHGLHDDHLAALDGALKILLAGNMWRFV